MTREEYRGSIGLSSGLYRHCSLSPFLRRTRLFYVGFGPSAAVFGVDRPKL